MNNTKKIVGLSDKEVQDSRAKYGENLLTPPKRESLWKLFFEKFQDPIIRVLLVAAAVSFGISLTNGHYAETIGLFFAIILATVVGFWFEVDANKKFDLLNQVNDDNAVKVLRNGNIHEVPKREVVVGDIVMLETGEEIPADGILIEAMSMQVNESALTGELMVEKMLNPEDNEHDTTYAANEVKRGTTVIAGHGMMQVTLVGDATEYGKVAKESTAIVEEKTPLTKQLDKLASLIGKIGFGLAAMTFIALVAKDVIRGDVDFFTLDGAARLLQYFMVAVTLIAVSVPEGLPMSVTLSLALNMRRMLKTNNLVRKMHASETMGATTVICTDKTGTLTQNQMRLADTMFLPFPAGNFEKETEAGMLLMESIAANSTAFLDKTDPASIKPIGNPTEGALLLWLDTTGEDYFEMRENIPVIEQLPFSTERKYMGTVVDSPSLNKRILYIKGAPEKILSVSSQAYSDNGLVAVSNYTEKVEKQLLAYQNQAMRTLGFAYKVIEPGDERPIEKLATDSMIFLGVVAIADPVREDVPDAVTRCMNAGIGVKIVTGDTPGTAKEIGRQIGLWLPDDTDRNHITGVEFEALSDEEALDRVLDLKIMSRARPTDKQRLVQLLQKKDQVVAVTGDGTNDAPALNFANVGLSMGTGTSVAKEASDITLLDDSFNSIATAVMWGRSLYENIQRFMVFQLTINVVAMIIVLIGSIFGTELPLTVTQMLWVNLIMDTFAAGALASLPPNIRVMDRKPRKSSDFIISHAMAQVILGVGVVFVVLLLGILYWFTNYDGGLTDYKLSVFFTIFVMLQFWNLFNAKAFQTNGSAFKNLKDSRAFLLVALIILVGQILIVQFGGDVFRTVPITLIDWLKIIGGTSVVLWIGEIVRFFKK
ncbi:MAG: calcium-translocating P-type ATPase, PMCA-type [Bacteroidales bacterium]